MSAVSTRWGWLLGIAFAFSGNCALAQITPDGTLPNNSNVRLQGNIFNITGGTQAGSNLFHSFGQFSVPTGGTAFFNNAVDIQNIISRVTGGSISNIDGLIRANGTATLFLINPSGIVFGQNASLNVGGSFVASTANAIQFGNLGFFSATDKNIPSPLLTINPSALLFNQINQNAAIQNNSVAPAGIDPAGFDALGLRVPDGKSLLLVGGNVSMDGGQLNANGGRVELGGLAEPGTLALGVDGDNLSLKFPDNVARASVSLINQAAIYVAGASGSNIVVNAKNLEILGGSVLSAGIGQGLGTPETVAGDIALNATEEIKVAGTGTDIRNPVRLGSQGNGGNITIDSGSFSLRDGAQLEASTAGQGNAGNVTVRAKEAISLAGNANILSNVSAGGVGNGGNIDINAATLSLIDGAQVRAITRESSATQPAGRGNAGNVNVNVTGAVDIAGQKNGSLSAITSYVETGKVGNGGNITIDSGSLSLRDSAALIASTYGQGNAGNVTVRAKDAVSLANASIRSTVETQGVGKGGNIDINAATLSLVDGAALTTSTSGQGNAGNVNVNVTGAVDIAGEKNGFPSEILSNVETGKVGNGGNITIDSGSFSLRDGAQLEASTAGQGNAGNVTVRAKEAISLAGNANILSNVSAGGVGNGGNIDINAATLSLIDGAQVRAITRESSATQPAGRGNAGNVNVNVTGAVDIAGQKNGSLSAITSYVETGKVGNGGNITIDSGSLSLRDSAALIASTYGQGNAGNVTVRAKDAVSLANASIRSTVETQGVGKGGNIDINAATLSLVDGAALTTSTSGQGNAGNVNVNVTGAVDIAGEKNGFPSEILSNVETGKVGNGGNITIDSGSFSLRDGAQLEASTAGQGNAGNVTVRAKEAISLAGNANILSNVSAGGVGNGGNIDINAATLSLIDGAQVRAITRESSATQPAGRGNAGNVNVNVTGAVDIAGQKNGSLSAITSYVETGKVGNGGNITIDSGSLSLRDSAALIASTYGQGNAGNVTVRAKDAVSFTNAFIFSTVEAGGVGKGGNIDINAATLSLIDGANLITLTRGASATQPAGRGNAGNVSVNVTGAVNIAGPKNRFPSGILSSVQIGTEGNGGNITIDSGSLSLGDRTLLEASTSGQGNAGNVTVRAKDAVSLTNANIFSRVTFGGVGKGGNIDINAATLSLIDGAQLATITIGAFDSQPAGRGNAGNVNVNVTGAVDIAGQKNGLSSGILSNVETGTVGNGGNITIDSGSFSLRDGGQLSASTSGQGNAGNVTVRAKDSVSLASANILSTVEPGGIGKGGNIDINAATLSLIDRAQLATITRGASDSQPAGRGDAGNVNVKVTGAVDIAGEKNGSFSAINSFVDRGTVGNGGNITIDSGSFSLRDGGQLSASTSGQGNAGNVTVRAKDSVSLASANILSTVEPGGIGKGGNIDINAATLSLIDRAQLATITRGASDSQPAGRGDAGNVNVKVTGAVDIAGEKNGSFSAINSFVDRGTIGNGGNITIDSGSFSLRDGAQLSALTSGQGNAGTIKVNTADFFTISGKSSNFNSSGLFVNSQSPTGTAGNIIVTSPRVTLDNGGRLNAESASGNGGNINLQSNLLLLRRNSQISTTAGTAEKGGNGGNINIDAGFIVAVPQENSDITANAFSGNGGTVTINAQGIFGIQLRQQPTEQSDITASSTGGGINGVVNINTLDIDPNRGLLKLPTGLVNTPALVASNCGAFGKGGSEFTVTGRGGLPPSPEDFLSPDVVWTDTRLSDTTQQQHRAEKPTTKPAKPKTVEIIPATGWVINDKGEVTLISSAPSASSSVSSPTCVQQ